MSLSLRSRRMKFPRKTSGKRKPKVPRLVMSNGAGKRIVYNAGGSQFFPADLVKLIDSLPKDA
jgi:hypothetical protein